MVMHKHYRILPWLLSLLLLVHSLNIPPQYYSHSGSASPSLRDVASTTGSVRPSSGHNPSLVHKRIRGHEHDDEPPSAPRRSSTITHVTDESTHTRTYLKRAILCSIGQKFCKKKDRNGQTATSQPYTLPTIPELRALIDKAGVVSKPGATSLFYTGMGGGAVDAAKSWFKAHPDAGSHSKLAYFNNMIPDETYQRLVFSAADTQQSDRIQKLLSQAFAESAIGNVYVCMPEDYSAKMATEVPERPTGPLTAWLGWEYPALTRNARVTAIHRIDPRSNLPSGVLWTRGDPPSVNEPLGTNWPRTESPR